MDPTETSDSTTTTRGTPVRQIAVFLHNRVGALMSLVKLLHDNSIEVLGLSVQESTELTMLLASLRSTICSSPSARRRRAAARGPSST